MSGTENTQPLRKNENHDSGEPPTYIAPARVVVRAVTTKRTILTVPIFFLMSLLPSTVSLESEFSRLSAQITYSGPNFQGKLGRTRSFAPG